MSVLDEGLHLLPPPDSLHDAITQGIKDAQKVNKTVGRGTGNLLDPATIGGGTMNSKPRIVRGFHRLGLVAGLLLGTLFGMCSYTEPGRIANDPGPFAMAAIGFLIAWLPLRILAWIIRGFLREPERPSTTEILQELHRRLKPEAWRQFVLVSGICLGATACFILAMVIVLFPVLKTHLLVK
jgi:hypothetical protein